MPSPPDASKAIISGITKNFEVCLFSCFFGLVPEMISIGSKIIMPKYPKIVIFSFQNRVPDNVGTTKPKEYIVAHTAVFP